MAFSLSLSCHGLAVPALCFVFFLPLLYTYITTQTHLIIPAAPQHHDVAQEHRPLWWFVQVSDTHLSVFDEGRNQRFHTFINQHLPVIQPELVLVTGDITDANKGRKDLTERRGQNVEEWSRYKEEVSPIQTKKLRGSTKLNEDMSSEGIPTAPINNMYIPWLDIRGNHDAFNVPSYESNHNFFTVFTATGPLEAGKLLTRQESVNGGQIVTSFKRGGRGGRHYDVVYENRFGAYRFLAIDAAVDPAPTRHFFGEMDVSTLDFLEASLSKDEGVKATTWPGMNLTFALGHYPTNSIVHGETSTSGKTFPEVLEEGRVVAYFSGHLHRLLSTVAPFLGKTLYSRLEGGTLELELGDFKYNSDYRIVAVDGDSVSFMDATTLDEIHILITNPKDARFLSPFEKRGTGDELRALVFSTHGHEVEEVLFCLDDQPLASCPRGSNVPHTNPTWESDHAGPSPLYVASWEPGQYAEGVHVIRVEVRYRRQQDNTLHHTSVAQPFSLDGNSAPMASGFGYWFMAGSLYSLVRFVAGALGLVLTAMLLLGPMIGTRQRHWWVFDGNTENAGQQLSRTGSALRTLVFPYLVFRYHRPKTYFLATAFSLWAVFGPWCLGPLLHDQPTLQFFWAHIGLLPGPGAIFSRVTVIPHWDGVIYLAQVFALILGPLVQLLSVSSLYRYLASKTVRDLLGSQDVISGCPSWFGGVRGRLARLPLPHPQAVEPSVSTRVNLWSYVYLFLITTGFGIMVVFHAVFHGIQSTIIAPVPLWVCSFALIMGWFTVVVDTVRSVFKACNCARKAAPRRDSSYILPRLECAAVSAGRHVN